MNGQEFLRKIKALGRERGVPVRFDTEQGKGSHGTLWYGDRRCTLKDRKKEIGTGHWRRCWLNWASPNAT